MRRCWPAAGSSFLTEAARWVAADCSQSGRDASGKTAQIFQQSLLSVHVLIHWHQGKHIHVVKKCRQLSLTWTSVCQHHVMSFYRRPDTRSWRCIEASCGTAASLHCIQGIVWSINTGPYLKTNWCLCSQSCCCWCKRSFMSDRLIRKPEVLRHAVTMQLAEVWGAALGNPLLENIWVSDKRWRLGG